MFCHHCGTDTPDDSKFCRSCGKSLTASPGPVSTGTLGAAPALAPQPAPVRRTAPAKTSNRARWVLLIVLALVVWWWIVASTSHTNSSASSAPSTIEQIVKQQHTENIVDGDFIVNAEGYRYYRIVVPQGAVNVILSGNFSASGGSGNDVEVYFLSDVDFVNWQSGHSVSTFYNSGRATTDSFNKQLPAGAGTYYLVFNNKFSLLTAKSVRALVSLRYLN